MALRYYEDDHDLVISQWESILDTAGYMALLETFDVTCRHWRLVQMADLFAFCLVILSLQRKHGPAAQLWGGILVQLVFTAMLWWHAPFLCWRQAMLEYLIKAQGIFNLIVGLFTHVGAFTPASSDALLVLSNVSTLAIMAYLMGIYQVTQPITTTSSEAKVLAVYVQVIFV